MRAHWAAEEALGRACEGEPSYDAPNAHTPEWEAERDAWRAGQVAAGNAEFDAQWAILETEPTTVAGVLALLDYVVAFKDYGWREFYDRGLEDYELTGHAIHDERGVSFEDDAMRFASRHLKRLLLTGGQANG